MSDNDIYVHSRPSVATVARFSNNLQQYPHPGYNFIANLNTSLLSSTGSYNNFICTDSRYIDIVIYQLGQKQFIHDCNCTQGDRCFKTGDEVVKKGIKCEILHEFLNAKT
jgi:hypothetical protein